MKYFLLKLVSSLIKEDDLFSGYRVLEDGTIFKIYDGNEVNCHWLIGDYEYRIREGFVRVPNDWNLEELRQNEIIYRPVK